MTVENLYSEKPEHYIDHICWEIVDEVPMGPHRVLDVGSGGGLTGMTLKQQGRASEVIGIEISKKAAKSAEGRLDEVIIGNVEQVDFTYPAGGFDFVILGDVLEHLINPWVFLDRIKKVQKENGRIIATIPNTRHWRVSLSLLFKGEWAYEAYGVLDKSHLRFFTRQTMISLFENSGLSVCKIVPMLGKNTTSGYSKKTKTALMDKLTLGMAGDLLAPEYLIVAGKEDTRA